MKDSPSNVIYKMESSWIGLSILHTSAALGEATGCALETCLKIVLGLRFGALFEFFGRG